MTSMSFGAGPSTPRSRAAKRAVEGRLGPVDARELWANKTTGPLTIVRISRKGAVSGLSGFPRMSRACSQICTRSVSIPTRSRCVNPSSDLADNAPDSVPRHA